MTALDEALLSLSATDAEWHGGLSNHGPMCVEALHVLGHDDAIGPWLDRYRPRLEAPSRSHYESISEANWADALGDIRRLGDWNTYFTRALDNGDHGGVLATWLPRLGPGLMAAATHGPIRAAHAVRAFEEHPTAPRRAELAAGLGYWAARYQPFRFAPKPRGTLSMTDALARMPLVPPAERHPSLIFEQVKAVGRLDGFEEAVDGATPAPTVPADVALDGVIEAGARAYLACPRGAEIAFIHTITGPAALRLLLPYLPDDRARAAAVAQAWLVVAAIDAAYADGPPFAGEVAQPNAGWDELAAAAVEDGDEHAIKLVETCRREHRRNDASAFLAAAAKVVRHS